jgi:multiple sugar transport system permease protein
MLQLRIRHSLGFLWILPAIVWVLSFLFYPLIYNVNLSFTNAHMLKETYEYIGTAPYRAIVVDDVFHEAIKNTITFMLLGTGLTFATGLLTGLLFSSNYRFINIFRGLLFLPWILPEIVTGTAWRWMLQSEMGVINKLLNDLRIISRGSVAVIQAWRVTPFFMILVVASVLGVDPELLDAASIDGASSIRKFRYIVLPQIKYPLVIGTLLTLIWMANAFTIPFVTTGGGPMHASELIATYIYETAFLFLKASIAAAQSVIQIIILLAISAIYLYLFRDVWRGGSS